MAKIFLDVGGHEGESVLAALDPIFGFDRVYCFEPVPASAERIRAKVDNPRLTVVEAGLFDQTCSRSLGDAGELGGSIYADGGVQIQCQFIRASDFFRDKIAAGDSVWMKLNCEGAEVPILNDLMDSGEANKLTEVLVDVDAAKFDHLRDDARALVKRLAEEAPFSYHYPPEVQYGMINNYGAIRNWLLVSGAKAPGVGAAVSSLSYQLPYMLDRHYNGYYKIRLLRTLGLRPPAEQVPVALRGTWSPVEQMRGPYYKPEAG